MLPKQPRNKNRKPSNIIIMSVIIFIILASITIVSMFFSKVGHFASKAAVDKSIINNVNTTNYNPPTNDQKQSGEDIKKSNISETNSTTLSVTITAVKINDNIIQIRAGIYGVVSNNGSCELKMSNSSTTVSKTSKTYALPSSSSCQGFDINRSELSAGKWVINLTVNVGAEKVTNTSEITLE